MIIKYINMNIRFNLQSLFDQNIFLFQHSFTTILLTTYIMIHTRLKNKLWIVATKIVLFVPDIDSLRKQNSITLWLKQNYFTQPSTNTFLSFLTISHAKMSPMGILATMPQIPQITIKASFSSSFYFNCLLNYLVCLL